MAIENSNIEAYEGFLAEALKELEKPEGDWQPDVFQNLCVAAAMARRSKECYEKLGISKADFDKVKQWSASEPPEAVLLPIKSGAAARMKEQQEGAPAIPDQAHYKKPDIQTNAVDAATVEQQLKSEIEPHPLALIFPSMNDEELAALTESIKANGQHEPVVMLEGKAIDGLHRLKSCAELGITPKTIDFAELGITCSPLEWVIDRNLRRRHLNESQRAMVASSIKEQMAGENSPPGRKAATAAKMMSVSDFSVKKADSVRKHAVTELKEMVQNGSVSVSAAAEIGKLDKDKQTEIVKEGKGAVKKKAARLREARQVTKAATKGGNKSRTKGSIKTGPVTAPPNVVEATSTHKFSAELSPENYQAEVAALLAEPTQFVGWVKSGVCLHFKKEGAE